MINIKLLSEILKKDVIKCSIMNKHTKCVNITYYPHDDFNYTSITTENVYELANMCKEWAYQQEYEVASAKDSKNSYYCETYCFLGGIYVPRVVEKTEPEAIFKSCEFILENREIK